MKSYILTHNGYKVEFLDTIEQVEQYMTDVLEEHKHLSPKEIYRGYSADNQAKDKKDSIKSVIIWQYRTMYTEVFMIEEREY